MKNNLLIVGLLLAAVCQTSRSQTITTEIFGSSTNAFDIQFVEIGNPNNSADTTGRPNSVGSVAYTYNLGKYEISRDQIAKANIEGGLGITLQDMASFGGNGAARPASGISWNEAAIFVNWLNTSTGNTAAYKFDENGSLQSWSAGQYSGNNTFRHKNAYYFLPTRDEWYKGAYGSPNGNWYDYPTGGDFSPLDVSGGTDPDTAVYNGQTGPADVTFAGGQSAFGTVGQGGNIWEWNETVYNGEFDGGITDENKRELRGGSWGGYNLGFGLEASSQYGADHLETESYLFGFRVASVPEPSALSLLAVGLGGLAMMRRRRS